jgi:ribosomal protein S9
VADAVANGIANGLLIFDPGLEKWLNDGNASLLDSIDCNCLVNLIRPNLKQRERKKPGQPSARANFQWVKR